MNNEWKNPETDLPPIGIEIYGFFKDDILEEFAEMSARELGDKVTKMVDIFKNNPDVFVCTFDGRFYTCMFFCSNCKT